MFKPIQNYEVDRKILKCDLLRFSPAENSTINTPNCQIYINIPRVDSVISLLNTYLDLNIEVLKKADNSRYGNGSELRLVNLGLTAMFSTCKLTANIGKHLEDVTHTHIVILNV